MTNEPNGNKPALIDQNVERLLSEAYHPEQPDAKFVTQAERAMQQAADDRRAASRPNVLRGSTETPATDWRTPLAGVLTVGLALTLLFVMFGGVRVAPPHGTEEIAPRDLVSAGTVEFTPTSSPYAITPRSRPPVAATTPVAIGQTISTTAGQRRRVSLPDGSVLFINQNTTATLMADRRIRLQSGEIYVEVSPREPAPSGQPSATFLVETPDRKVTALGTKFSVGRSDAGTGVLVVQGKVQLDNVRQPLSAGQQWLSTPIAAKPTAGPDAAGHIAPRITVARRASHLLAWTTDLVAAAESPLIPHSDYVGGAIEIVDPDGQKRNLSLRKYHIDVVIEDGFARTTIDQTYFNHLTQRIEGTFRFPLPADASISRLAMYVGGRLMEGGMVERNYGRQVFESIKYRMLDPALLEWVDGNTFKMRVFPLEGRQEKRIVLSYTQRLNSTYGQQRYRFPAGHNLDRVGKWSTSVRVVGRADQTWQCDSHVLASRTDGDDLILSAKATDVAIDRDLVVTFPSDDSPTESVRFALARHESSQYLMVRYRPQLIDPTNNTAGPRPRRDWIFLFEASADRNPLLARVQIDVIAKLLDNIDHDDTFQILTASTRPSRLNDRPLPATPKNIAATIARLEKTHLIGALDLERGLIAAQKAAAAVENPVIVHLGSATPVLGQRQVDRLETLLSPQVPYVGVGVGRQWNRALMRLLARRSSGYVTRINPNETAAWRAFDLLAKLNAPRLVDLRVEGSNGRSQWLTYSDWLLDGDELCAVTRLDSNQRWPDHVIVTGRQGTIPFRRELAIADVAEGADYLPRQWARKEIDRLLEEGEQHKDTIITLSKQMYVMSPYTSLIVLEDEKMYAQYKVDRGRKDHWALYPCPEKIDVVHEPLIAKTTDTPHETSSQKRDKSRREILETILVRKGISHGRDGNYHADDYAHTWSTDSGRINLNTIRDPAQFRLLFDNSGSMASRFSRSAQDRGYYNLNSHFYSRNASGRADFDALIDLIMRTIEPDAWDEVAGGSVAEFETNLSLVISQTQEVHRQPVSGVTMSVATFLAADRRYVRTTALPFFSQVLDFSKGAAPRWEIDSRVYPVADLVLPIDMRGLGFGHISGGFAAGPRTLPSPYYLSDDVQYFPPGVDWIPLLASDRLNIEWSFRVYPIDPPEGLVEVNVTNVVPFSGDLPIIYPPAEVWEELARHRKDYSFVDQQGRRVAENKIRNHHVFGNVLAFAPGMQTSRADVFAVIEEELKTTTVESGDIDPKARQQIEKARRGGWKSLTSSVANNPRRKPARVAFDGQGRFRIERTTPDGLDETIVCDGTTLWHVYPEIDLAAKRTVSRFHRRQIAAELPWLVLPVEDLARGADVRFAGENAIELVPLGAEKKTEPDNKPARFIKRRLVFDLDGGLTERRWIEMPSGKTLLTMKLGNDGAIAWLDTNDKQLAKRKFVLTETDAADLNADVKNLAVVPMPLRTVDHILSQHDLRLVDGVVQWRRDVQWSDQQIMAAVASACYSGNTQLATQIMCYWISDTDREDWQAQFYKFLPLLAQSSTNWHAIVRNGVQKRLGREWKPLEQFPDTLLGKYLVAVSNPDRSARQKQPEGLGQPGSGLLSDLAHFQSLLSRIHNLGDTADSERPRSDADLVSDAVGFARQTRSPWSAWFVLQRLPIADDDATAHSQVASGYRSLNEFARFRTVATYERAAHLSVAGQHNEAKKQFERLFEEALEHGTLPWFDARMRQAFKQSDDPFASEDRWQQILRRGAKQLVEEKAYLALIRLAWQCRRCDATGLADQLVRQALDAERQASSIEGQDMPVLHTRLAAMTYYWKNDLQRQADRLLTELLDDKRAAGQPLLWRMGAISSERHGRLTEAADRHSRAVEIVFSNLEGKVDIEAVRHNFVPLMNRYEQLGRALQSPSSDPPANIVAGVVAAADRWRSLEVDVTQVCSHTAKILNMLGADELAWDYATTALAGRGVESTAWVALARTLSDQGTIDQAARAYETAYAMEPTNAEILWQHAQMLENNKRSDEAMRLYRKISQSDWQPRFQGYKSRATQRLTP